MFLKKQILYLKIFFFISSISLITENGYAQNNKKYELSIGLKNIFFKQENKKLNYTNTNKFDNYLFQNNKDNKLGVGLKIHNKQHAFRFNLFYKYDSGKNDENRDVINFSTNFFSGYQLNIKLKYFQIYYGSDILFGYQRNRVDNEIFHVKNFGICPLFGVNYFVTDNLSVSAETKLIFGKKSYKNSYRNQHYIYNRNNYAGEQNYFESSCLISVNYLF
ncbi:MAG: hypothetical protein DRJ01_02315 [Bacteroidetes bacterium]|nr:MAG: hypothetical protein DRJ01_02315 [Bacteroidota bacterium]